MNMFRIKFNFNPRQQEFIKSKFISIVFHIVILHPACLFSATISCPPFWF